MDFITSAIQSVESVFSVLFSVLPSSWASIVIISVGVYLTYVVVKIVLDLIGTFF